MKRVLLTGISGTGKSTLAAAFAAQGYKAIDADTDEWCEWVVVDEPHSEYGSPVEATRDWVWREDRIQALLDTEDTDLLFVNGCAINMRKFLPRFDHIILLSLPPEVIRERLTTRTNNLYGKQADELARVLSQKETVEPHLRAIAEREINTNTPLDKIMDEILEHVG